MKLNDILKQLLVEGRLDFFRDNEKLIRDKWQALSEKDELSEKEREWRKNNIPISDDLLIKMSEASEKYLGWIISVYKKEAKLRPITSFEYVENRFTENLYKYKIDLDVFSSNSGAVNRKLPKKTIDLYDNQKELHETLKQHGFISETTELLVFKGDTFNIYIPNTKEQSCFLGKNTKWCTSHIDEKHNSFDAYHNVGELYIVINRSNPTEKYLFHFETNQFMDKKDKPINIKDFFIQNNEIYTYFKNKKQILTYITI